MYTNQSESVNYLLSGCTRNYTPMLYFTELKGVGNKLIVILFKATGYQVGY